MTEEAVLDRELAARHNAEGSRLMLLGSFDEAKPELMDATRLDPRNPAILSKLGVTLMHLQKPVEAEGIFRQAVELTPDDPTIAKNFTKALYARHKFSELIRFMRCVPVTIRDDPELLGMLIRSLVHNGNFSDAVDLAARVDDLSTLDPLNLSLAYEVAGMPIEAIALRRDRLTNPSSRAPAYFYFARSVARLDRIRTLPDAYEYVRSVSRKKDPKVWVHYQLARYFSCDTVVDVFDSEPELPIDIHDDAPLVVATGLSQLNHGEADPALDVPQVNQARLSANVTAFKGMVADLVRDGHFDVQMNNFNLFRERFGGRAGQPVFVLSTGRCGTLALNEFLKKSSRVSPYHDFRAQLLPIENNHLLYRVISGAFDADALIALIRAYLETRTAEYLYTLRYGRTPVITYPMDTVFAPVNAVLFPESRFIHLRRDETAVFRSFYGKGIWFRQMLQYYRFDPTFPDGRFEGSLYESLEVEAEIAWHMFVTRALSEATLDDLPPERKTSLRSEDVFRAEADTFEELRRILPIDDLEYEDYTASFEIPINAKEMQVAADDLDRRAAHIAPLMDDLRRDGWFLGRK